MTPAKHPLALPSRALAEAVAAEWAAQGEHIDPATMPLTRLAHAAIDGVAGGAEAVAAEIERYAGSDLVLYRATEPEGLVAVQAKHWDPVLAWASEVLGARFTLAARASSTWRSRRRAIKAVRAEIARYKSPFQLAALASLTNISGSALLALALGRGRLSVDEAWAAAHVDEDWNVKRWGEDAEAVGPPRRAAALSSMRRRGSALLDSQAAAQPNFTNSLAKAGLILPRAALIASTLPARAAVCSSPTAPSTAASSGANSARLRRVRRRRFLQLVAEQRRARRRPPPARVEVPRRSGRHQGLVARSP